MESEFEEFKIEATELLDTAENCLLAMDKACDSTSNYDSVFRVFHNLKGGAGMLGVSDLEAHVHKIETLFLQFKGQKSIGRSEISFFLRAVDATRSLLDQKSITFDYTISSSTEVATATMSAPVETVNTETDPSKVVLYVGSVGQNSSSVEILTAALKKVSLTLEQVETFESALQSIQKRIPVAVYLQVKNVTEIQLSWFQSIAQLDAQLPVVVISTELNSETLLNTMRLGARSVLKAPLNETQLLPEVLQILRNSQISKLVRGTLDLVMYQFSDLEDFLISQGKFENRDHIKKELSQLMVQFRESNHFGI